MRPVLMGGWEIRIYVGKGWSLKRELIGAALSKPANTLSNFQSKSICPLPWSQSLFSSSASLTPLEIWNTVSLLPGFQSLPTDYENYFTLETEKKDNEKEENHF